MFQPRCRDGARRQAGATDELDQVLVARLRQHLLVGVGRIALPGDGERGAELHRRRTQRLDPCDVLEAADATGGDQRDVLLDAGLAQEGEDLRNDVLEFEARIVQLVEPRGAQVAAGQSRVLDHDRIGQPVAAHPLAHQQLHTARVGQDGHEQRLRMVLRQLGQVERQAGTHHHRINAALERTRHRRAVFADGAHHVDREQPAPTSERLRRADLALQRFQVRGVDGFLGGLRRGLAGRQAAGALHQVGMVATQVDRRDRADAAQRCDAAGQPVGRHADTHAALHDGQQRPSRQTQGREAVGFGPGHQIGGHIGHGGGSDHGVGSGP